jgi:hypothetical protein
VNSRKQPVSTTWGLGGNKDAAHTFKGLWKDRALGRIGKGQRETKTGGRDRRQSGEGRDGRDGRDLQP